MSNNAILFSTTEKEHFSHVIISLCQAFPGRLYINSGENRLTLAVTYGTDSESATIEKIKKTLKVKDTDKFTPAYLKEAYEIHSARFLNNNCEPVRLIDESVNYRAALSAFSKKVASDQYNCSQNENAVLLMRCISATTDSGTRAVFETEQLRIAFTLKTENN